MALIIDLGQLSQAQSESFAQAFRRDMIAAGIGNSHVRILTSQTKHEKADHATTIAVIGLSLQAINTSVAVIRLVLERHKLSGEIGVGASNIDLKSQSVEKVTEAINAQANDAIITLTP